MTGAEVKAQVMEALRYGHGLTTKRERDESVAAALAPCVVLTREEAERVRQALRIGEVPNVYREVELVRSAFALLSPDEAGDE